MAQIDVWWVSPDGTSSSHDHIGRTPARLVRAAVDRPRELRMRPRLASWDAAATRNQQELSAYLADTEDLLRQQLAQLNGPWAFRLDVGVPPGRPLLEAADLDTTSTR